jgi:hypothetical protein
MIKIIKNNWPIIAIILLSIFFRFWQIGTLPNGLFPDEAANGLDVNSIFKGNIQPFYERGNGRESLFFYLLAFSVWLFGRGPWQHHIISAGIGVLTIFASYFLVKELFNKKIANITALLMATSSFLTTVNRTAFRANMVPLFSTLVILFLVKYLKESENRKKIYYAFACGISFGLGFYSYISYRMMIPMLFGLAIIFLFTYRPSIRQQITSNLKYFWFSLLGFVLSFGWLGYYFFTHKGSFIGRAGQVSIFTESLNHGDVIGTFIKVLKLTFLGFFTNGDLNWRHNVSGYPFLSPFVSPFFGLALIIFSLSIFVYLFQAWKKTFNFEVFGKALVAIWFWLMLIPEITTAEGIPHGLRLLGVVPAMFILPAWMISKAWDEIKTYIHIKQAAVAISIIFFATIIVYDYNLYFKIAANSLEYDYAFRSDLTFVSKYLNSRDQKNSTYLSLDKFSVQTVEYFTTKTNNPYILLDPAKTYEISLKRGDQVLFTQSTLYDRLEFLKNHPDVNLIKETKNRFGQIVMLVYEKE